MKLKLLAVLTFVGFIGSVYAGEPTKLESMPTVSKCMVLYQKQSVAAMNNTPANVKAAEEYLQMSFTQAQLDAYSKQITEWNNDPTVRNTYNTLKGEFTVHGKSLTPALLMSACIKAM